MPQIIVPSHWYFTGKNEQRVCPAGSDYLIFSATRVQQLQTGAHLNSQPRLFLPSDHSRSEGKYLEHMVVAYLNKG